MNKPITMAYRMKYLAIGIICYPVVLYAWNAWIKNNPKESTTLG